MWFEILPALLIVTASVAAPHAIAPLLNYLVVGNFYRRLMETRQHRLQYLRDRRLTGDPYKVNGLESLPDEEPNEEEGDHCAENVEKEEGEKAEEEKAAEEKAAEEKAAEEKECCEEEGK